MKRRAAAAASMTSLIDVLFILVFASLVSSVGLVRSQTVEPSVASSTPAPSGPPSVSAAPPVPRAPASTQQLRERALASLSRALGERRAHFVRVAADGRVTAIETEGDAGIEPKIMAVPLLARVADPDVVLEYLGDRIPDLRICALLRRELALDDLRSELVIIAPERPLAELPVALARGLVSDVERCAAHQGLAVLVGPDER